MSRWSVALLMLFVAIAGVVAGTKLRDRGQREESLLAASMTELRAANVRLETQRVQIARRPSPFRGCPDESPNKPFVACFECLGRLKNAVIALEGDTGELLGEIEGRIWQCRRFADVERAIENNRQSLASAEVEISEAQQRVRRGGLLMLASFGLAIAAVLRALLRR